MGFDGLRRFWRRLPVALVFAIAWLLVDEWLKEGYIFKLSDLLVPGSHETIIIALAVGLVVSIVLGRRRKREADLGEG